MNLKVKLKGIVLMMALLAFSFSMNAQTLEEAQKAYNAGVTAKGEGNLQEAITQFTTCVGMCETLYEEDEDETAEELMYSVQAVIPGLYLQMGTEQLKNQQVDEGVETLKETVKIAGDYGDAEVKDKAEKYLAQVYYKLGASKYKAGEMDAAIAELDKALEVSPDYIGAYYLKTVVYKKKEDDEMLKSTALEGIAKADASNETKYKEKIQSLANSHFLKKGNDAKTAGNYDEAITNLNSALEFNSSDVTSLYLLSSSYLEKGSYDEAIEAGNKGVEAETGGEEAQAKIYMIIAESQAKKGDVGGACATYKKAAVGQYAELANYRIEHELKCE